MGGAPELHDYRLGAKPATRKRNAELPPLARKPPNHSWLHKSMGREVTRTVLRRAANQVSYIEGSSSGSAGSARLPPKISE